jgi:hypothetical protein
MYVLKYPGIGILFLLHRVMNYGRIFWGNSSHSVHVFRLHEREIRIITGQDSEAFIEI